MTRELTEDQQRVRGYLLTQSERSTWLELWPRVMQARLELVEALRGMTDEQARFQPSPEEWSSLEVANHIVNNSRSVIRIVGALVANETPGGGPLRDEREDPREARIADLRTALIETGIELSTLIATLPDPPPLEGTHPHVFFGPLHCKAWYLFQRVHDLDHAQQVTKNKAAEGFPAA